LSDENKLFNTTEDEYGNQYKQHLIEQYKLYVDMADRISQRRISTNTFYITVTSLILTVYGITKSLSFIANICVLIAGILLSISWHEVINSYKQINSVKWHLVHDIEEQLPICPYKYEWLKAGEGKDKKIYSPTSHLEKKLPIIFGLIFLVLLISNIFIY
jgi:hypothetical protein